MSTKRRALSIQRQCKVQFERAYKIAHYLNVREKRKRRKT